MLSSPPISTTPLYYEVVSGVDWGSVPDWLAGVGAVTALLFAGIAARAALLTNDQQNRQLVQLEEQQRQRDDREIRSQAALIAAWIQPDSQLLAAVHFVNGSPLPIYDLRVTLHTAGHERIVQYAVRGPNAHPIKLTRSTETLREALSALETTNWRELAEGGQIAVSLSFTDSNSRRWNRDPCGTLSMV